MGWSRTSPWTLPRVAEITPHRICQSPLVAPRMACGSFAWSAMTDIAELPWSCLGWTPRYCYNAADGSWRLLVARNETICVKLCQGMCNLPDDQTEHCVAQSATTAHYCGPKSYTLPDYFTWSYHQPTHVKGVWFHPHYRRPWLLEGSSLPPLLKDHWCRRDSTAICVACVPPLRSPTTHHFG